MIRPDPVKPIFLPVPPLLPERPVRMWPPAIPVDWKVYRLLENEPLWLCKIVEACGEGKERT